MPANPTLLALLGVLALALIGYGLWPRKRDDREAVRRRLGGQRGVDQVAEIRAQARASAASEFVNRNKQLLRRITLPASDEEQTNIKQRLATAGFRQPQAQTMFLASKSICAVVGILLAVAGGFALQAGVLTILGAAAGGAGLGLMLPNIWLSTSISARQQKLRHALPDSLDLLVVSVEAGLGLDAALKRVGDEMAPVHPELAEELQIATLETQMGLPRGEALGNMARRTGLDEVRGLVSVITQAEKFGTSVARALRNQAQAMRTRRRQKAEEQAQKTAVKLLVPLIMFIFPALFAVLGGPAVINTLRALKENPSLGR